MEHRMQIEAIVKGYAAHWTAGREGFMAAWPSLFCANCGDCEIPRPACGKTSGRLFNCFAKCSPPG